MRNVILITAVLIISHLCALYVGSSLQLRAQHANSHAHLSDVSDAICLGEYFTQEAGQTANSKLPGLATAAIIFRILHGSTPGPNSKVKLQLLETQLRSKYATSSIRKQE